MISPLENLCGPGKSLRQELPDAKEFAGLKHSGRTRLADAENPGIALESRFDLAYNAAYALCLAALRRLGYRATNRYIVFQVLPHTLGLGAAVWGVLAKCHDVRNLGEYTGDLNVDKRLLVDPIAACKAVQTALDKLSPPAGRAKVGPLPANTKPSRRASCSMRGRSIVEAAWVP